MQSASEEFGEAAAFEQDTPSSSIVSGKYLHADFFKANQQTRGFMPNYKSFDDFFLCLRLSKLSYLLPIIYP